MYGWNKVFSYHECQRHVRLKSHKLQTQLMISVFMMNETVSLHGIRVQCTRIMQRRSTRFFSQLIRFHVAKYF